MALLLAIFLPGTPKQPGRVNLPMAGFSLILALLVSTVAAQDNVAGCLQEGCNSLRHYTYTPPGQLPAFNSTLCRSRLVTMPDMPQRPRCVSNGVAAVCTAGAATSGTPEVGLAALDVHGRLLWAYNRSSLLPLLPTGALPLMNPIGQAVASDGAVLVGVDAAGQPLGPPIVITPAMYGGVYSLGLTANGVIIIASRRSTLAGYLTNGIPHASIRLNATSPDGKTAGLYVPRSAPVVNVDRIYLQTVFVPGLHGSSVEDDGAEVNNSLYCRIYAVDVARTLNNRMSVAWWVQTSCPTAIASNKTTNTAPSAVLMNVGNHLCWASRNDSANASLLSDSWTCLVDNNSSAHVVGASVALDGQLMAAAHVPVSSDGVNLAVLAVNHNDDWNASLLLVNCSSQRALSRLSLPAALNVTGARWAGAPVTVTPCLSAVEEEQGEQKEGREGGVATCVLSAVELPDNSTIVVGWTVARPQWLRFLSLVQLPADSGTVEQQMLWLHDSSGNTSSLVVPTTEGLVYIDWNES